MGNCGLGGRLARMLAHAKALRAWLIASLGRGSEDPNSAVGRFWGSRERRGVAGPRLCMAFWSCFRIGPDGAAGSRCSVGAVGYASTGDDAMRAGARSVYVEVPQLASTSDAAGAMRLSNKRKC